MVSVCFFVFWLLGIRLVAEEIRKIGSWKIMWYGGPYRVFRVHAIVFEPFKFDLFLSDKI